MRKFEVIGAVVIAAVLLGGTAAIFAADFGFGINTNATAADVGLPLYPGAKPHRDDDKHNDSAAKIWGSFGAFGMKIAAVELDSKDEPGRVAGFYRDALRKHGPVLDCSAGQPRPPKAAKDSKALDCEDDHADPGEFVFKTGQKDNFRLVGVEPQGRGSKIALVQIQMRGVD